MKKRGLVFVVLLLIFLEIPFVNFRVLEKEGGIPIPRIRPDINFNQTENLAQEVVSDSEQGTSSPSTSKFAIQAIQKTEQISAETLLTGKYGNYGNDTDGDGEYNQLVLVVEINTTLAGNVSLTVELKSNIGYYSWQESIAVNSTIGIQNISVPFEVGEVYSEQLVTAYKVVNTQITLDTILFDEDYSNYTTRVYSYLEFDPPKVYLSGLYGLVEDDNIYGYIDTFYFVAGFEFTYRGFYLINVSYHTVEDNHSSWIVMDVFSNPGNLNIEFFLDTTALYLRKINTSYSFDSISIQDAFENTIGYVYFNYTTRVYLYLEFAPPVVIPTGIYSDQGIDTNSNGKIDALEILIGIDITSNVNHFIIYLEISLGALQRSIQEIVHLQFDSNVSLLFDVSTFHSYLMAAGIVSTTFQVTIIRISSMYSEIIYEEENPYVTRVYFTNDFDSPIIAIEGNQSFAYFANLEGWEGTGTSEDPYILEELVLNGTSYPYPIIEIWNTQVHFILRECTLFGAEIGIQLRGVENALLANNRYENLDLAIDLSYCAHITIDHSIFLSENMTGVVGDQVENIVISNNELRNTERGMRFEHARNLTLRNNILSSSDSWLGIELEEVDTSKVINNTIKGFNYAGIVLDVSSDNLIDFNVIIENGYAIRILGSLPYPPYYSQGNIIRNNLICANSGYGLYISKPASNNFIQGNIFSNEDRNGTLYAFDSGNTNNFSKNYWHELNQFVIEGGTNTDLSPLTSPPHLTAPSLIKPNGGEIITWTITIQWLLATHKFNYEFNYSIYYSDNNGSTWQFLSAEYNSLFLLDGRVGYQYQWILDDDYGLPGSEYLIQVIAKDLFGLTVATTSNGTFTIETPGNTSPRAPSNLFSYAIFSCAAILLLVTHLLKIRKEK